MRRIIKLPTSNGHQWINMEYFAFAEDRPDQHEFHLHLTDANLTIPITGGNVATIRRTLDRMAHVPSHEGDHEHVR